MTKRIPLALLVLGSWFLSWNFLAKAENTPNPSSSERVSIDQTLTEIDQLGDTLHQQVEKLFAIIDTEISAKRVSELDTRSLRMLLRILSLSSQEDLNTILENNHFSSKDAPLTDGIKVLQNELVADQQRYADLVQAEIHEMELRVVEVTRTVEKVEDIDPLIASLKHMQQAAADHNPSTMTVLIAANFIHYLDLLQTLRRIVAMGPQTDPATLSAALGQLQIDANPVRAVVEEGVIRQRIQKAGAPYQKALDDAQESLDHALQEKAPAATLRSALAQFERATQQAHDALSQSQRRSRETNAFGMGISVPNLYRNLVETVSAMEAGELARARNLLANLHQPNLQSFGAARAATYDALIADWEKDIAGKNRQAVEKQCDELAKNLATVKTPADLETLCGKLAVSENDQTRDRNSMLPQGMSAQLQMLAAAWTSANPLIVPGEGSFQPATGSLALELTALRGHIKRDVFAQSLHAPQLNEPPLADMPLEAALEKLSDEAAAKSDWHRLLQLTECRSNSFPREGSILGGNELAMALRAFLAGQNFELAEQWNDAVQCYKTVLRSTDLHAPIQQAADRLKALKKSHPEALSSGTENPAPVLEEPPLK